LELLLLQNDVSLETAEEIIEVLKNEFHGERIGLLANTRGLIQEAIKNAILQILTPKEPVNLIEVVKNSRSEGQPAAIVFVGVNGTGKTTTLAKIGYLLKKERCTVVFAASDTFRAGSIEQLKTHGQRLKIPVIAQEYKADAAAVTYDAISHAAAKGIDVVLSDTAGRMQTQQGLMDEIRKIVRVNQPNLVIFVGDALAGNDVLDQAKQFDAAVGFHAAILTKMDANARGGAALSITHSTGKPIIYLGTGQDYKDLTPFDPEKIAQLLF
ncbi:MAG: signal recognition particle-docking protein FtsY, partial [Candidatus Hodarchaeota archaeon]